MSVFYKINRKGCNFTRTKTSIRYDKEKDREKRERERKVEGEI
jgi:hypothetical protein